MRTQDHFNSFVPVAKELLSRIRILRLRFTRNTLRIGVNCHIDNCCTFDRVVMIGDMTRLFGVKIGRYSYIGPQGIIMNSIIGQFCSIGPGVKIGLGIHPLDMVSTSPYFYELDLYGTLSKEKHIVSFEKVEVGNDVWIGANAMIMGGVKIGNGAVIGAGAIVNKDVEPYSVVIGIPARHLKYRLPEEQIQIIEKTEWYNWDISKLKCEADIFLNPKNYVNKYK